MLLLIPKLIVLTSFISSVNCACTPKELTFSVSYYSENPSQIITSTMPICRDQCAAKIFEKMGLPMDKYCYQEDREYCLPKAEIAMHHFSAMMKAISKRDMANLPEALLEFCNPCVHSGMFIFLEKNDLMFDTDIFSTMCKKGSDEQYCLIKYLSLIEKNVKNTDLFRINDIENFCKPEPDPCIESIIGSFLGLNGLHYRTFACFKEEDQYCYHWLNAVVNDSYAHANSSKDLQLICQHPCKNRFHEYFKVWQRGEFMDFNISLTTMCKIDKLPTPAPTSKKQRNFGPDCLDTCEYAKDGFCDDSEKGSETNLCGCGTDCTDCGQRNCNECEDGVSEINPNCNTNGNCPSWAKSGYCRNKTPHLSYMQACCKRSCGFCLHDYSKERGITFDIDSHVRFENDQSVGTIIGLNRHFLLVKYRNGSKIKKPNHFFELIAPVEKINKKKKKKRVWKPWSKHK